MPRTWLADAVLLVHAAFVLFVIGGFALIVAGARRWRRARHRGFRVVHLAAIGFVALESLAGIACPLTRWEDQLRDGAPQSASFVGRWVGRLLFYNFPEWIFTLAYCALALVAVGAWFAVPPERLTRRGGDEHRREHDAGGCSGQAGDCT